MRTWIALLRGINVGGAGSLPMTDLRALLAELGFRDVQTYIQSGNCLFRAESGSASEIAGRIGEAIAGRFGFRPAVLVLTVEELEEVLARNPYPQGEKNPRSVHFFFHAATPRADLAALEALRGESESFSLSGRVLYLHAPDGIGFSKLAMRAERILGVPVTARNYATVAKIAALARALRH